MVNLSFSSLEVFLSLLALVIYLFGVLYSALIKPVNPKSMLFILFNSALAVWSFAYTLFFISADIGSAVFWYRFSAIGYCTYYAFAVHLTFLFYGKNSLFISYIIRFFYLSCIPFIILFCVDDLNMFTLYKINGIWNYSLNYLPLWYLVYLLISLVPLIILLYPCICFIKKSRSPISKKKYTIIFYTQLIALSAGIFTNIISTAANLKEVFPMAHVFILIYILGLGYLAKNHSLISLTPAIAADQILSRIVDMIILTDPKGNITEVNESLKNTLGYTGNDLIGKK